MKRHFITHIVTATLALGTGAWAADDETTPGEGRQRDPAAAFQRLDANGDGELSKDEFKKLATFGQGKYKDQPEVFDRLFERLDADRSGVLSPEEFKGLTDLRGRSSPPATPTPAPTPQQTAAGKPSTPAVADAPGGYRPGQGAFTAATQDATWTDAVRRRDVPVRIYAPELKHGSGLFPTIIFSHGGGESREAFTYLGTYWAERGYIVVFLTHQGSDRAVIEAQGGRGIQAMQALAGIDQFHLRPEDVRFILDKLLSGDPGSELLRGRVDAKRIGIAGQCAGSTTALAMVGLRADLPDKKDATFMDPRFRCAIALSPQMGGGRANSFLHKKSWEQIQVPTLVVTGSRDFNWMPPIKANPRLVQMPYDGLPPGDKYLVEIKDAEHNAFTDSVPYYPARERDPRHHVWIQQATTAFFDAYLKGDIKARDWLKKETLELETHGECRQELKPAAGSGAATAPAPHEYNFRAVDHFMEQNQARYSGGAGLILTKDGQVIHRKAYGDFTPERVVPIASASKWISGCVIMALVDEGKLSLDDKASKYLPEFTGKKGEITIRQMFSHTHGLKSENEREKAPHRNTAITLKEAADLIMAGPLERDPGTALNYSGIGMHVAGRIAEIATGKPWVQIFQEKLAGPCELKHTDYYAFGETQNPNVAGSIRTCLDDYGNIMTMLLGKGVFKGKRVLSEKAVAEMFRNQTGSVPITRHAFEGYGEADPVAPTWRYGIGCWLEEMDPKTGQASRASSGGAFGCLPFVDYGLGLAGVYLPYSRDMKRNAQGNTYNDATVVYLELKPVIAAALTAKERAARGSPTGGGGIEPWRLRSGADAKTIGGGGPHAVGVIENLTLRDAKRGKDLPLRVTYPEGQGKFPIILFSHCAGGRRDDFGPLVRHWVSHGYVVLQMDHADVRKAGEDWRNRTLDMSFLLDSLDEIGRKAPTLAGKMDATRVGAGGHLIGAYASCASVGMKGFKSGGAANQDYRADPRVNAAMLLSPQGRGQGLTEKSWEDIEKPMLVAGGSEAPSPRTSNPPEWRTEPYRFAKPGDKYLLWIEEMDNSYAGLARGDVDPKSAAWILDVTTAFWDAHLKQDANAQASLKSGQLAAHAKGALKLESK